MTSGKNIDDDQIEKILGGIQIPAQPTVLLEIQEEARKISPDIKKISNAISKDVGLSAAVLKTVNSPFYGLRNKVDSIQRGAILLGVPNLCNIVRSAALRQNMSKGPKNLGLDKFWETAVEVANIALFLANNFKFENPDEYYTLGLFHDAGIAVMMQKFENYKETLNEGAAMVGGTVLAAEDAKYQTNHAVVGYYLARSWSLSDTLTQSVLHHHDVDNLLPSGAEYALRNQMLAVLKLASQISHAHHRLANDCEWDKIGQRVMTQLDLSKDDYADLSEDLETIFQK